MLVLLGISLLIAFVIYKIVHRSLYWHRRGVPYESLVRSIYRVVWLFNTQVAVDVLREDRQRYGRVYGSFRGFTPSLVCNDAGIVKELMIKQFNNFFKRSFELQTGDLLWDNLLSNLPYKEWKFVRTVMSTCLTTSKLKGIIQTSDKFAKRSLGRLREIAEGPQNAIALHQHLASYGLDSVVASSFGVDLNSTENPDSEFLKAASGIFEPSVSSIVAFVAPSIFRFIPFLNFPPKRVTTFFEKFVKHIIAEKRKNLPKTIQEGSADILDNFLIAQQEDPKNTITDEVLASQAFLFYLGGVDTTVVTLEMITYYMALHPSVQTKAWQEIQSIMGERKSVLYEDVIKMKYLEASVYEALRMHPALTLIMDRVCTETTTLESFGIEIEKGSMVEIPIVNLYDDPELFPKPESFVPERFLKEDAGDEPASNLTAFLAFGEGPKNCPGKRLAVMNIQVFLCNLLMEMKLETCEETPKSPLVLKPGLNLTNPTKEPIIIRLVPRDTYQAKE